MNDRLLSTAVFLERKVNWTVFWVNKEKGINLIEFFVKLIANDGE